MTPLVGSAVSISLIPLRPPSNPSARQPRRSALSSRLLIRHQHQSNLPFEFHATFLKGLASRTASLQFRPSCRKRHVQTKNAFSATASNCSMGSAPEPHRNAHESWPKRAEARHARIPPSRQAGRSFKLLALCLGLQSARHGSRTCGHKVLKDRRYQRGNSCPEDFPRVSATSCVSTRAISSLMRSHPLQKSPRVDRDQQALSRAHRRRCYNFAISADSAILVLTASGLFRCPLRSPLLRWRSSLGTAKLDARKRCNLMPPVRRLCVQSQRTRGYPGGSDKNGRHHR